MIRFARAVEEPLRGIITLFGMFAFVIIIPWLTDIEGWIQNWMEPTVSYAIFYIAAIIGVFIFCAVAGYYLGKWVTWPLRYIIEKHDQRENERQLHLRARYHN